MMHRRCCLRYFSKLLLVARRSQVMRSQDGQCRQNQHRNRHYAHCLHAALRLNPRWAMSETKVAQTVTNVTTIVRFTNNGKSRASAACHASCPIPATSLTTSIGSSTPIPILIDTPTDRKSTRLNSSHGYISYA